MEKITDLFGSNVFGDDVMRERLPKDVYKELKDTIRNGKDLDLDIANAVAHAMKEWALEKGATHFTHWFQPLTGITAEKHDSFICPTKNGGITLEFSGKELIKGEPDASSFPSGGLRATFEARGYTAWDPSSYAFVKENTLCIPTAFCSYSGEVLDKKTPLLRSMEAISKEAKRITKLFGHDDVTSINTTVGCEQEYFLIDRKLFEERKDLKYTGRTLLGARPPKGQELDDHYFGNLRPRVSEFMHDLDLELWKYGIFSKTKHNEVAPSQHEMAPVFTTTNLATDQNQLTMEIMKKLAEKHGLACLLQEKPFAGVNGSGKHNNWSISTDTGLNLLEPGVSPKDNAQFLLFLVGVITAVDKYQDLLRWSVASPGNDHRLGANEAPPAIVSMFLGDELTGILEAISQDKTVDGTEKKSIILGVHVLPDFIKDTTDRNRTSPFAFTGNKFEFRMLGSAASVANPNTVLNTCVADVLGEFADRLEGAKDFGEALRKLVKEEYLAHKRIVFNGNNYSAEWLGEAKKRGLLNLVSSIDAFPVLLADKNVKAYEKYKILNRCELASRVEISFDSYVKTINIEALTFTDMIREQIIPSCNDYLSSVLSEIATANAAIPGLAMKSQTELATKISGLVDSLSSKMDEFDSVLLAAHDHADSQSRAVAFHDEVLPLMSEIRVVADELELMVDREYWPVPTYGEMLYSV